MLRDLRNSAPNNQFDESASASRSGFGAGRTEKDENEDTLGSSHVLLEDSSNSMVNMAISLDPLDAQKALGRIDQEALQR